MFIDFKAAYRTMAYEAINEMNTPQKLIKISQTDNGEMLND